MASRNEVQSFAVTHSDEERGAVSFATGRYAAFVASGCFCLANLIIIFLLFGAAGKRPSITLSEFESLNTTDIQEIWDYRRKLAGGEVTGTLFNAFGLIMMLIAILCVNQILPKQRGGVRTMMVTCFAMGSSTICLEVLLRAGLTTVASWIDDKFTLSAGSWRAAELAFILIEGHTVWLFAADWLFMCLGLGCFTVLVWNHQIFTRRFAVLTLTGCVLSGFAFIFEILRFASWEAFSILSAIVLLPLGFLLIPIWLVLLGRYISPLV